MNAPFFERLSKLRDVSISSPTDTQVLTYDLASAKWKNGTGGGGGGTLQGDWNWTTSTTDAGNGRIGVNAGTWAATTIINISKTVSTGGDATNLLALIKPGDGFYLQQKDDATIWARFTISSAGTDHGTYISYPVTYINSGGALPANNRLIGLLISLGGPSGTVTNFSSGNLSPLFTTSVSNPTTTPALSFALSTTAAHKFFGNNTGSTAAPDFYQPGFSDLSGSLDLGGGQASGTLAAARFPALTGDATNTAGTVATTVAKINGVTYPATAGSAGALLVSDGSRIKVLTPASLQTSSTTPTGTTSTTGVMMGLGSSATITPTVSGRIYLAISGTISNNTTGDGVAGAIRFGTGTAPINGAAPTGTGVGPVASWTVPAGAANAPYSISGVLTGLTIGTAYWIDVVLNAITGGTASIKNTAVCAFEF